MTRQILRAPAPCLYHRSPQDDKRTTLRRPELLAQACLTDEERRWLEAEGP